MSDSTLNASEFRFTTGGEGRQVDPILEAVRLLRGDEGVRNVVDSESRGLEGDWDPWHE